MHILLIVNELAYFQAHRRDLMLDLVKRGNRVSVAVGASTPATMPERPQNWPQSVGFYPFKIDRHRLNPVLDIRFMRHIRRICRIAQPDVVHAITIKPVLYAAIVLSIFRARESPALVLTLPGLGKVFEPTHALRKRGRRRLVTEVLRRSVSATSAVLTTENPQDRNRLVEEGIVPAERAIAIAGAGLDRAVFNTSGRPPYCGPVRVLMASRLIETKGVGLYIEAAHRLASARLPMTFTLAGPIDPTDADVVEEQKVHEASSSGVVTYLGAIAPSDMAHTLQQFDVVVLPTLLREGFPRALLEAVACGCVPVASDQPAIRQLVHHGKTGLLLKPVNADTLEAALKLLASDEDLRETLKHNAIAELGRMAVGREQICDAFLSAYALALRSKNTRAQP